MTEDKTDADLNPWSSGEASRVESALSRAAESWRLEGMAARAYRLRASTGEVFGLTARLGPAHRRPGWSTHAILEVFDPHYPHLGMVTVLDRRNSDGLPSADSRSPVYTFNIDRRCVLRFLPVARAALASLHPGGAAQLVNRNPGRCTVPDACMVPLWVILLLRSGGESEHTLIITDFQGYEHVARLAQTMTRGKRLQLFPRTDEPSKASMTLPPLADGMPYARIGFSSASDRAIAAARASLTPRQPSQPLEGE
ncbi:hypothetical protein LKL35_36665 [Streptomyces sp. ET3-23]|uniref:hypothetical protein n=1 Tax=Streptomyces sp. ET3-23 TaxID=2885643 RepID=UPI001D10AF31|nr:hypothetical protein [Streptomyces sp. ET3-23]MCC2280860.1 hypothetical protein [Streptomyces sp. ET3-23]